MKHSLVLIKQPGTSNARVSSAVQPPVTSSQSASVSMFTRALHASARTMAIGIHATFVGLNLSGPTCATCTIGATDT